MVSCGAIRKGEGRASSGHRIRCESLRSTEIQAECAGQRLDKERRSSAQCRTSFELHWPKTSKQEASEVFGFRLSARLLTREIVPTYNHHDQSASQ